MTLPFLWGCRFPASMATLRGCMLGLTGSHSAAHIFRSTLEGLVFEIRRLLGGLGTAAPSLVLVAGGGTASSLLLQILADVVGSDVTVVADATSLVAAGAAMIACSSVEPHVRPRVGIGSRTMRPDPSKHAVYTTIYESVYLPLVSAIKPICETMQAINFDACDAMPIK